MLTNKDDHSNETIDSMTTYRASVTQESCKCLGSCTNLTMASCSLFESIGTIQGATLIT